MSRWLARPEDEEVVARARAFYPNPSNPVDAGLIAWPVDVDMAMYLFLKMSWTDGA